MNSVCRQSVVIAVRTPTGLVVRGGPGVATHSEGSWSIVVDGFVDRPGRSRLESVLHDAAFDPVASVIRHFASGPLEIFALIGPGGVLAGSTLRSRERLGVLVDLDEGLVALSLDPKDKADPSSSAGPDWISIAGGTAVSWGPAGPEILFDLRSGRIGSCGDQTDRPTSRSIARTAMSLSNSS